MGINSAEANGKINWEKTFTKSKWKENRPAHAASIDLMAKPAVSCMYCELQKDNYLA